MTEPREWDSKSPMTRSSESVTVALVVASYARLTPVALTFNARAVMLAVVVALVELNV